MRKGLNLIMGVPWATLLKNLHKIKNIPEANVFELAISKVVRSYIWFKS